MKKGTQLTVKLKVEIDKVIIGDENEFQSDILCANEISEYLKEKYGVEKEDFDSNGWDYDFWIYYTINDKKYMLSGSGYYGGITFSKNEAIY
jgi:hypothetical protein